MLRNQGKLEKVQIEEKMSLFVVFIQMTPALFSPSRPANTKNELVCFHGSVSDLLDITAAPRILHLMPTAGSLSFQYRTTRYNVTVDDYVILPNTALVQDFAVSDDYCGLMFSLSTQTVNKIALRSNYGIIGHLSLLQNPVMRLTPAFFERCRKDIERLRQRALEKTHPFYEEMLEHLLAAHILDLYAIHAQNRPQTQFADRAALLLRRFIEELSKGSFRQHRDLEWYAQKLFVTPHYLSEICRRASGRSASYFINLFTVQEISALLIRKELPIQQIAEDFSFCSASYFTRYVVRHLGMTPLVFRNTHSKH